MNISPPLTSRGPQMHHSIRIRQCEKTWIRIWIWIWISCWSQGRQMNFWILVSCFQGTTQTSRWHRKVWNTNTTFHIKSLSYSSRCTDLDIDVFIIDAPWWLYHSEAKGRGLATSRRSEEKKLFFSRWTTVTGGCDVHGSNYESVRCEHVLQEKNGQMLLTAVSR